MSLDENLARLPSSTLALLREVKRLNGLHQKPSDIAEKLGLDRSYINGVIRLLNRGEDNLVARVEAGQLPMDVAIRISTGKDADIRRALSEAYENGTLRGSKLLTVQKLINQRKNGKAGEGRRLTGNDLVRAYEHHTQQQRALVRRSAVITHRLAVIGSCVRRLLKDENFVTLLRAEGLPTMPDFLAAPRPEPEQNAADA